MTVTRFTILLLLGLVPAAAHGLDWAGKVQQDIKDLKSPSVEVRLRALTRLGKYQDRDVKPLVLGALRDPDSRVQRLAATLAADRRLHDAVPLLQRWLSHWDTELRLAAAQALGRIGAPSAVKSLVRAVVDPEIKVRLRVIKALGQLHAADGQEVVALLGRLRDTNAKVRRAAADVLAEKRDPRAVIPLMGRLDDSAREVRLAAINALGELGDPKAGPSLVRLLRDPSHDIASAAIKTLGQLRYTGATEPLIDLFKSGAASHRRKAALALARLGTDLAIRALVDGLANPSQRPAAQRALTELGDPVGPYLAELLRDPRVQRPVAVAAVEVTRDAKIKAVVPLIIEQLRLGKLPLLLLIETLGAVGDPRAQRPLLDLLGHPGLEVRLASLKALRRIVDQRAAAPLAKLLDDRSRRVRLLVLEYLGRLRSRQVTPRLITLATAQDRVVARAAVGALSRSRDPRAVPVLIELLNSRDRVLRRLAAQGLARIHAPSSVAPLVKLCRDSLGTVRVTCVQALGGVLRGGSDDRAFKLLAELVYDPDRSAFLAATDALAAMHDRRIPELLLARYPALDPPLARKVVEILGNQPDQKSTTLPFLLKQLENKDPHLRAGAAWAVGKLGAREAAARLLTAARDPHWMVRTNAAAAVARLGLPSSRSLLRTLVQDPVAYVRANAVLGLGRTGDRASAPLAKLTRLLFNDRSPWVRLNALRALRQLNPPAPFKTADGRHWQSLDKLTRAVTQEDLDVRVRRAARRMLRPAPVPQGSWVGLYLLDHAHRPLRNAEVVLITPAGFVRATLSDGRAELWEENLTDGYCQAELPPPGLIKQQPSEN